MIDRRALLGLLAGLASLPALPGALHGQPDVAPPPGTAALSRIAFGSCADQRRPQLFWDAILAQAPELMILMGDNVYGDVTSAAMTELREAYAAMAAQPGFQRFRARVPILARDLG